MNAVHTIQCIAGELYADPAEVFEIIREEEVLLNQMREFLAGNIAYETLRDSVVEYC